MDALIASVLANFDPVQSFLLVGIWWRLDRRLFRLENHPALKEEN